MGNFTNLTSNEMCEVNGGSGWSAAGVAFGVICIGAAPIIAAAGCGAITAGSIAVGGLGIIDNCYTLGKHY